MAGVVATYRVDLRAEPASSPPTWMPSLTTLTSSCWSRATVAEMFLEGPKPAMRGTDAPNAARLGNSDVRLMCLSARVAGDYGETPEKSKTDRRTLRLESRHI